MIRIISATTDACLKGSRKGWSQEKAVLVFENKQEVKIMPIFLCGPDKFRQF